MSKRLTDEVQICHRDVVEERRRRRRRRRPVDSLRLGPSVLTVFGWMALLIPSFPKTNTPITFTMVAAGIPRLIEEDRVREYNRLQYQWPPRDDEFVPPTPGWTRLLKRRLAQADQLTSEEGSYDAYVSTISSMMIHNYTQYGWGVTKAPASALQAIYGHIIARLGPTTATAGSDILDATAISKLPLEVDEPAIDTMDDPTATDGGTTSLRPKFLRLPDPLLRTVLQDVLPIVQAWAGGTPLVPHNAYGLRIYQNTSKLHMHLDVRSTHVVSAILHVGHDAGTAKKTPWPLVIEGFDGTTNEIHLHPGELLLYESSKCLHGRVRRMEGSWYTSLFLHYHPVHHPSGRPWRESSDEMEWQIHHRVPPHWRTRYTTTVAGNDDAGPVVHDRLVMLETSVHEIGCPDGWCGLKDSVVVEGPAPTEFGKVLTANGEIVDLQLLEGDVVGSNVGDEL